MTSASATPLITPADRIFVAGHRGMAGSTICRALPGAGHGDPAQGGAMLAATRQEMDLLDKGAVLRWSALFAMEQRRPIVPGTPCDAPGKPVDFLHVGTKTATTIHTLDKALAATSRFACEIMWDRRKPDETSNKQLEVRRTAPLDWRARIPADRDPANTIARFRAGFKQQEASPI